MATPPDAQAAERQVLVRAEAVILGIRHSAFGLAAAVSLVTAHAIATPFGTWLLGAVACWATFRLVTRSRSNWLGAADFVLALAVCVSIPAITDDPKFYESNSAPLAIAGTSVVTFSLIMAARWSVPMMVLIAATYACGAARVIGWDDIASVGALYYFAVQWVTATVVRRTTLRVASAVDRARTDRKATALTDQVSYAIRDNEAEHLALLHDTAASTLLLVGQGASLPPDRLAAQARRDLVVLAEGSSREPDSEKDLVDALRDRLSVVVTPIVWDGLQQNRINAALAGAVAAAAREACNNVDRHAHANTIRIDVGRHCVMIVDDGVGFDSTSSTGRHGITESLVSRMRRAGGRASVRSTPGHGTTVVLEWLESVEEQPNPVPTSIADADRLAERVRVGLGLVLVAYALLNLAFAAQFAILSGYDRGVEAGLAALSAAATVVAVPRILGRRIPVAATWLAAAVLAVVSVAQPLLLDVGQLGERVEWTQSTIGWCLLPLVLGVRLRTAAIVVLAYWFVPAAIHLVRDPAAATVLNIGLGTASILTLQLFGLFFSALMRGAATAAHAEAEAYWVQETGREVARAVRDDHRRRTQRLASSVLPLLSALSAGAVVDDEFRLRASSESRKLRMLFDNAAMYSHPLLVRLRPAVDAAEARGVSVTLHAPGDLPELSEADRVELVAPVAEALGRALSSARIVLTTTAEDTTVSIVCDVESPSSALASLPVEQHGRTETVLLDDSLWLTTHHRSLTLAHGGA